LDRVTNDHFEQLVYRVGSHLRKAVELSQPGLSRTDDVISELIGDAVADIKTFFDYDLTKGDAEAVWRARGK
jgi:hypothetical protein